MARSGDATSILFVGNSYTNRNDLPGMLERFGLAGTPARRVITQRVIANGMSLKTHWDRGRAAELIANQKWDFVVLQDQSTMPLKNPARLAEYAAKFDAVCRAHHARTALYLTWARQDAPTRQPEFTRAYQAAAGPIDALIVPVGIAFEKSLLAQPKLVLHDRDKSHPSAAGTYLAACVFYATLLRQSPVGLPTEGLKADQAAALQRIASRFIRA